MNFAKAIWLLQTNAFFEKVGSSVINGPEILPIGSHCTANFQPILDCFMPNFKLKYEDSENVETTRVNTVVFNLHHIKQRKYFRDTWYRIHTYSKQLKISETILLDTVSSYLDLLFIREDYKTLPMKAL